MQKTIEVVYEKGVFKPLERVDFGEGEKVVISIETGKKEIREIKIPLREYNDFLPRDFTFTLEKLRTDSRRTKSILSGFPSCGIKFLLQMKQKGLRL